MRGVQVTPSGDVITLFVPLSATVTNSPFPYVTLVQDDDSEERSVQLIPSGDVITLLAPLLATATNNPLPKVILVQLVVNKLAFNTQLIPSRE